MSINATSMPRILVAYSTTDGHTRHICERLQALLERLSSAFFSVNIVARKPEKSQPSTNPYLLKFLQQISWKPTLIAVFAGKLDYPSYRFFDRLMIRLIMRATHGPTDPKAVIEFTDWTQVEAFSQQVSALPVRLRPAP